MNPTLLGFIRKELTQTLRDVRMRLVLFIVPLVQLTIFGFALSNEVKNIRIHFFYQPSDRLMQEIEERSLSSKWFINANPKTLSPFDLIQSGEADAVVIAPKDGLTRAFERGDAKLQVLIDSTNALRARSVENYLRAVTNQVARNALSPLPIPQPLSFDVRVLYNPTMETSNYMVPGVMCMILCILTVILTSMAMAREKETGTFETLISAPITDSEILLGKTIPYILLAMCDVPLILSFGVTVFGVPMRGPLWMLLLAAFVFICTTVGIGILISTYAKNQQQAMMGGFLFMFPAIQLSGIMAPIENIPGLFKIFAALNPLRYFVEWLRR